LYTVFAPDPPSYSLFPSLHPTTGTNLPTPSGRTCFALLFSNFAEEKIKKIRKMTFLLVCDKGCYTGSFL
jgi:hypothetical protein